MTIDFDIFASVGEIENKVGKIKPISPKAPVGELNFNLTQPTHRIHTVAYNWRWEGILELA